MKFQKYKNEKEVLIKQSQHSAFLKLQDDLTLKLLGEDFNGGTGKGQNKNHRGEGGGGLLGHSLITIKLTWGFFPKFAI